MKLLATIPIKDPSDAAEQASRYLPAPPNDLQNLREVVYELCLNVLQWSESTGSVLVEEDDRNIILTVEDSGIGIPASIRKVYPDLSNEGAVDMALQPGATSSGSRWRGYGLNSAVRLSDRDRFGIYLATRDVAVWVNDGLTTYCNKSGGSIAGTLVQIIYSSG